MAYKLTPEQYKDVALRRITNKNTAENTNSAVSAYARALNASRALDNKNKQNVEAQSVETQSADTGVQASDDWFIRTLSTVASPVLRFSEGVAKFFENAVLDAGAGLTASVLDIFGADEAAKDVQAWAAQDAIGEFVDWAGIEQIYQNSWSNEWGSFGELLQEGIYSVGQQAIPFALNFIPGAGTVLSMGAFAVGAYGGGFESASQDGGSVLGASAYGLVSAALETAIEGLGGAFKFGKGTTVLSDAFDRVIEKVSKRAGVQNVLGFLADAVGEGAEEVLSGMLQNYIQAMTYKADTSSVEAYFNNIFSADPATQEELWEQFILGAVSGAMLGGASRVATRFSPTMQISESIQEAEELREKGYNLNRRGKDTTTVEEQLVAGEQALMEQVNAGFETLTAKRKDGNAADKVLSYMESNFNVDENGKFISSKNGLVKSENVSYGVTEKDIEKSIVEQGNKVHEGTIVGEAAETKSVVERTVDNYNKILGRKNHSSRLKLVFADIAPQGEEVRSYGYLADNVVVIDVNALNENVDFQVFQNGETKTYSANAAMSTLLHEVFHFTEKTKAGEKLRKVLIEHATLDNDNITAALAETELLEGEEAAKVKEQELIGADLLSQTLTAYKDKNRYEQGSELSARQLENLLFNEKVIERLTEDNSTLAKRILNNAKRVLDALKGVKIAETKELETLLGKTVKLYNKAIAQVGGGKYLTTRNQTQYSKRGYQPRDYSKITKEEYEHHAWATVNGVLSAKESGLFMKKIGEKKLGTRFNQAADGSYMVPVGENGIENKVVFTDGNWDAPSIDHVFYIKVNDETSTDIVRGFIYESKGIIDVDYFDGLLEIYNAEDFQYGAQRNGSEKDGEISEGDGIRGGDSGEVRHSLRLTDKTDSTGRALTEGQAEFFKNSKAVDKNGKLQVVFHGTYGEFYTFDKNLRGSQTGARDARLGFFFTSSKDVAWEYAVYAQDNAYYNKMNKIANGDRDVLTWLGSLLSHEQRKNSKKYQELAVSQEVIDFVDLAEKTERFDHDVKELYLNIENPYERDWEGKPYKKGDMLKLVTKALQGGYDGVIIRNMDDSLESGTRSDVFVVFEANQIKDVTNKQPTAGSADIRYSRRIDKEKGNVERSDEFRRVQAESLGLSDEDVRMFHRGSRILDEGIRGRLSRVFRQQLLAQCSGYKYDTRRLTNYKSGEKFSVYGNVDANTFHDIFKIVHNYLRNGDAVDIHDKEYYTDCINYLTEDGLSGFSITNDGDLISVFNLGKRGFLRSIRDYVREQGAVSLDCYQSKVQELANMYEANLGFKTASILDFNYDVLVEDRGKEYADYFVETYGEAPVHFMVLTDADVEVKHFQKDDYVAAVKHQRKYISQNGAKHSRRIVSDSGVSRSIDDTLEMLSVLGNINEDTHRLEIGKKQLLDNYIARINDQAAKGYLSERSKVIKELVDAIFDTAIMAEYHDADYLTERIAVIDVLRKYFHSMNLTPIKSEIQGEYGRTNNIFRLWGNKGSGRSWDSVVQEIVEEMPQLAVDSDASGISTLYNIFNSYEKAVQELKAQKVKVSSFIKEADEVKHMMAKQLVLSLKENSTELITRIEASVLQNELADLQNAVEDTFRAVRLGERTVFFRGENLPSRAEMQLRKIVEDMAKDHAAMYADKRASDLITRLRRDLTDAEIREIKKTDAYKELETDIADRYLKEHKEISLKSLEEDDSVRILKLKQAINAARRVHRLMDMSREALKTLRDVDMALLKNRANEIATDDTHIALIDALQGKIRALFEETSDGKSILITKDKMLSSGALLDVVTAAEEYLKNDTLMEDFKVRGEFEGMQKKAAAYKEYIASLSGSSYNDMSLVEKLTFENAMSSFIADVSRATKPASTITVNGETVSATKYRDRALRSIYITLHKDKNGNYRGNKRSFAAFWAKYFQESVRPFEAIALAENHAGGLEALYKEVREGYIKGENARADLEDIFLNFVNNKENQVGKKSYSDYLMQDEVVIEHSEGTFVVTKGELLGLYLTLIQEDGFMHADAANPLAGGIYFDNKNMLTNYRNAKALKFTAENVAALEQHFSETDIRFIEVVREFFIKAGEMKGSVDMRLYGMERLLGDEYYPLQTDESARESMLGDKVSFYDALDPSGHLSINQSRALGVKALRVRNIADLMTSYAKSVGLYYGVAIPVADMRMVYSSNGVYGESIKDCISKYSTKEFDAYLNRLLLDVQGAIKIEDSFMERQRQRYATYAIAANIKSPIKALGGLLSLTGRLKTKAYLKGIIASPFALIKSGRADFSQMYEYCPATRMRYRDHQATMAAMNVDSVSRMKNKIVDKLAIGIELVDKYTIYVAWNSAKAEVGAVGKNANNPELLRRAGKLLNEVMDTTDRFEMTERNAFSRSPDALRRGFSMFTSASQAQLTQFIDKISKQAQLHYLSKNLSSLISEAEANKATYTKNVATAKVRIEKAKDAGDSNAIKNAEIEFRKAKAQLLDATLQVDELRRRETTIDREIRAASVLTEKTIVSISLAIVASAALSQLMSNMMGDKDEEEWGEDFLVRMIDESIANVFSMLPLVGQLYNALEFKVGNFEKKSYDMSFWLIDEWNALANAFNAFTAFMDGTGTKPPAKVAYELLNAIGMWTGIPIRNLYNTVNTLLRPIPTMRYEFQNWFSKGSYGSDLKKAIDAGDAELADTITRLMMKDVFGDTDTKVVATVRSLYEQGCTNVLPKTVSKTITIDGVSYEMTTKQRLAFKKIYSQADASVQRLIGKQSFVNLSPKVQADAIKWIYDYYYERAKEHLSGVEVDSRKALFGAYINVDTLAVAYSYCRSLEADTNKKGKAINGTRKAKVVKYLNSLKTSAAEKYMILGYLGYSPVNAGAKTLIASFARRNGASKAEIAELLEECNIAA